MSDTPQGPEWWLGTDGKWYPPVAPAQPGNDSPPTGGRRRGVLLVVAGLVIAGVIAAATVFVTRGGENDEDRYLAALEDTGSHDWVTDRAAVNAGYTVCEQLEVGGPPRGSASDRIAVEHLCPDYLDAFRVLETADVTGTFTVIRSGDFDGAVGSTCRPSGGYGDINSSTQVVVRNPSGAELARTSLGPGEIERRGRCTFTFEFPLTEGEATYIVEVGSRGEISYSWEQVSRPGAVALSLGD